MAPWAGCVTSDQSPQLQRREDTRLEGLLVTISDTETRSERRLGRWVLSEGWRTLSHCESQPRRQQALLREPPANQSEGARRRGGREGRGHAAEHVAPSQGVGFYSKTTRQRQAMSDLLRCALRKTGSRSMPRLGPSHQPAPQQGGCRAHCPRRARGHLPPVTRKPTFPRKKVASTWRRDSSTFCRLGGRPGRENKPYSREGSALLTPPPAAPHPIPERPETEG